MAEPDRNGAPVAAGAPRGPEPADAAATVPTPTPAATGSTLPTRPCTGCGERVVWATRAGGHPVALEASDRGTLLVQARAGDVVHAGEATAGAARSARLLGRTTYIDHATACPHPGVWVPPAPRRRPPPRAARRRR